MQGLLLPSPKKNWKSNTTKEPVLNPQRSFPASHREGGGLAFRVNIFMRFVRERSKNKIQISVHLNEIQTRQECLREKKHFDPRSCKLLTMPRSLCWGAVRTKIFRKTKEEEGWSEAPSFNPGGGRLVGGHSSFLTNGKKIHPTNNSRFLHNTTPPPPRPAPCTSTEGGG